MYAIARVLQVVPTHVPALAVVALHVICPLVFAVVHGAKAYGWRGILVFIAICFFIGNAFENLSLLTGFPFGHYYFTNVMGPKLFHVPVLLGLAYIGMGYLSWTLSSVLADGLPKRIFLVPVIAAFVMVAWDLSQEPVWATIVRAWIWRDGGPYFGVPLSNFAGWFLTVYIIYQLFALYLRRGSDFCVALRPTISRLPIVFYAVSSLGNVLLLLGQQRTVMDATGTVWRVRDITATCALVSIFTMGSFAVLAWSRTSTRTATSLISGK